MKIAFTSSGTSWDSIIDPRFGRTDYLLLYDQETSELLVVDNLEVKNDAHGAGTATAQKLSELNPDVLITGNGPGETASNALKHLNIRIFVDANNMTVRYAYEQFQLNKLKEI
jgi:predicted Fe-Mo cluster-binding NifX family protein